jgi:hypothetical protein
MRGTHLTGASHFLHLSAVSLRRGHVRITDFGLAVLAQEVQLGYIRSVAARIGSHGNTVWRCIIAA